MLCIKQKNVTEKHKVRENPGQTTVTSFSCTLLVLFMNIPVGALKPNSGLQLLTAINRQKNRNGRKQQQQETKESNITMMYLEKETQLITIAMSNIWISLKSDGPH